MDILGLIKRTRSYRVFDESHKVTMKDLSEMVNCARLASSARNQQSLKYVIVTEVAMRAKIFSMLKWAGYLQNWDGPAEGQRPSGYIVVLNDKQIANNHFCDDGIAMQNMMLCATTKELGSCIIASFNKKALAELLDYGSNYELLYVVAVGKPAEEIVLEEIKGNDYKYWRDENQVHHVPKRSIDEVILDKY